MKGLVFLSFLALYSLGGVAQQRSAIDFTHLKAVVNIEPSKKAVSGDLSFSFDVVSPTDSLGIDARKMEFSEVLLNGRKVDYQTNGSKFWIKQHFDPAKNQELQFHYKAKPSQAMYFVEVRKGEQEQEYQVWTQGQGKYTSHWLPSFDDPTEKLEFDLSFVYPHNKTVIANGVLKEQVEINDSLARWDFDMNSPMSSYLVAVAAGDYEKVVRSSKNDIPIELYYPTGKKNRVEPTYRFTEFLLDFFEKETGIPYPWEVYKQIPVQDFLYAGMENTAATIFSDIYLIDSIGYHDQNYVNVNAHELAHQWFGNLVTAATHDDHWLQEGFATYFALLAEKEIFGEDYFYRKLFKTAEELKQLSDAGKGEAVAMRNGSSLTYYQKGAWALHILNELVGQEAFHEGIRNFLNKYEFSSATTINFLAEMEAASGLDLSDFEKNWLRQVAFQGTEALESLKRSPFIQKYLELAAAKPLPVSEKRNLLQGALRFPVNDYLGQEAVLQLALEDPNEVADLYKKAFASGNLYTRQAIAFSLQNVPLSLKTAYESLLNDDSYLTMEMALYHLWMSFPQDRKEYLDRLEGIKGLPDKNVETLWLTLSLATAEVPAASKKVYFEQLSELTAPYQKFQVREKAFGYLYQLDAINDEVREHLEEAAQHPNYRFREFARGLLKTLNNIP
ncbi:M1 family metallopeptidase [Salinimicrobium oceani]|uniref:Aminopeptidase N n=1 Tax=Salinimicrobium oceani TaxID=2722702 RepID=A0ABX1CT06_9FLAO|nr:M1 family metallopeptidase [Salinimicrobium oceani]NJW51417.1 M1 family metallopeptidase [Salinimicrobium oceani]